MTDPKPERKALPIQIHLDESTAEGRYVNMTRVFHSQTEFVMDSMFLPPQAGTAKVMARLTMSPVHAKRLVRALSHNVALYEQKFGEIQLFPNEPDPGSDEILH